MSVSPLAALLALAATISPQELQLVPDLSIGDGDERAIGIILEAVEDSEGNLYLADSGFTTIHVFDREGTFLREVATPGEGPGMLMVPFVLAIDGRDRLYVAGAGGRVAIWDSEGNHIDEFRRANPSATVNSIGVGVSGEIVLSVYDAFENTIVDIYAPDGREKRSIASNQPLPDPDNLAVSEYYGGGSISVERDGNILYTQKTPYLIQRYSPTGDLLQETTEGGAGWLPQRQQPDTSQPTFSLKSLGSSIDIRRVGDFVLNNASRRVDEETRETLLTLYDAELKLVAKTVLPGLQSVVGVDSRGRVLIFTRDGEVPTVTRYELHVPGRF